MIVFHHIVRTGGMSVIANITQCNPRMYVLRRDSAFLGGRGSYHPFLCDFLHGHFGYGSIPPLCDRFTFARHPIARLSSIYYSLRQVLKKHGIAEMKRLELPFAKLSIAGGVELTVPRDQLSRLDTIESFIDEFLFTNAFNNLNLIRDIFTPDYTNSYDFIGITEKMPESMMKLHRLIKTDINKMPRINTSDSQPITYKLQELTEFYGEEIEAYDKASSKLSERS